MPQYIQYDLGNKAPGAWIQGNHCRHFQRGKTKNVIIKHWAGRSLTGEKTRTQPKWRKKETGARARRKFFDQWFLIRLFFSGKEKTSENSKSGLAVLYGKKSLPCHWEWRHSLALGRGPQRRERWSPRAPLAARHTTANTDGCSNPFALSTEA